MGEGTLQCVWALSFYPKTLVRAVGTELFTQGVFNSQHPLPVPSKECCTIQEDKVSFAISTPFSQIQRKACSATKTPSCQAVAVSKCRAIRGHPSEEGSLPVGVGC